MATNTDVLNTWWVTQNGVLGEIKATYSRTDVFPKEN